MDFALGIIQTGLLCGIFLRLGSHATALKTHADDIKYLKDAFSKVRKVLHV